MNRGQLLAALPTASPRIDAHQVLLPNNSLTTAAASLSPQLLCSSHKPSAPHPHAPALFCLACGADASPPAVLICVECAGAFHSFCLDPPPEAIPPYARSTWRCEACKVCAVCTNDDNGSSLLVCERCERSFHTYCLRPPLKAVPDTLWLCAGCEPQCAACPGSVELARLVSPIAGHKDNPLLCEPCTAARAAGHYCKGCQRTYDKDDYDVAMVSCNACEGWVHIECDAISPALYEGPFAEDDVPYECPECRPPDAECWWLTSSIPPNHRPQPITVLATAEPAKKPAPATRLTWSSARLLPDDNAPLRLIVIAKPALVKTELLLPSPPPLAQRRLAGLPPAAAAASNPIGMDVVAACRAPATPPPCALGDAAGSEASELSLSPRPLSSSPASSPVKAEASSPPRATKVARTLEAADSPHRTGTTVFGHVAPPLLAETRTCYLCSGVGDRSDAMEGRLLHMMGSTWVHAACALWSSGVRECFGVLHDLWPTARKANKQSCTVCRRKRATLNCSYASCRVSYHFGCAVASDAELAYVPSLGTRVVRCGKHAAASKKRRARVVYDPTSPDALVDHPQFSIRRRMYVSPTYAALAQYARLHRVTAAPHANVPFRIGAVTVVCVGAVVDAPSWYTRDTITPANYTALIPFWSVVNVNARAEYRCDVVARHLGDDNAAEPMTAVWRVVAPPEVPAPVPAHPAAAADSALVLVPGSAVTAPVAASRARALAAPSAAPSAETPQPWAVAPPLYRISIRATPALAAALAAPRVSADDVATAVWIPLVVATSADEAWETVRTRVNAIRAAANAALARAAGKSALSVLDRHPFPQYEPVLAPLRGRDMFGLSHPTTRRCIESLPLAFLCAEYNFEFYERRSAWDAQLWRLPSLLPAGAARLQPRIRKVRHSSSVARRANAGITPVAAAVGPDVARSSSSSRPATPLAASLGPSGRAPAPHPASSSKKSMSSKASASSKASTSSKALGRSSSKIDKFDDVGGRSVNQLPQSMQYRELLSFPPALRIGRSRIQGHGLFAEEDFPPGTMLIEYRGEVIRSTVSDVRERRYDSEGIGCYMFKIDDEHIVDATKKGNEARFVNHSCDPNCTTKTIYWNGDRKIIIVSRVFIRAGTELTYDYKFQRDEDPDQRVPCACGARTCSGFMS
ncbi:SET-domain-containing protein [Thecamonas trahens ATCC 50062]|uniref:SET-domain-containing protein n=1 Tax=Thecamonas trahens ATCC 50062 TaxID=461836 RepID=A0A0L0D546_THETB|nr:SET-domain-containing protein [Thecamonas trahens ATCC 50062]KNC47186.1 SET-domain-containing protein [Thecamonas trahens ATCC 50062]|eukprot:XP_013759958.1 SET-domain-containing protein [Thecamonas trahens ATCC 50062]